MNPKLIHVIEEKHSKNAHFPLAWELAALQLRCAMEVLYRRTKKDLPFGKKKTMKGPTMLSLHPVYLMIAGFMLEALMKGVLVHRKWTLQKLDMHFGDHNLLKLASAVGINLSAEERFFLDHLTQFVKWIGRYPVPKNPAHMQIRNASGTTVSVGWSVIGKDIEMARSLADRLEAMLPEFGPGRHLRTGMRLPSGKRVEKIKGVAATTY